MKFFTKKTPYLLYTGDCLDHHRKLIDQGLRPHLIFGSPPYEMARSYGMGFNTKDQLWVDWAADRFKACYKICGGLTAWVVEGQTSKHSYSATPMRLAAKLYHHGVRLRKPPIYRRSGIPGSGGNDWLRNDYEFIVCAAHGKLPWSDNTAMGAPPKYAAGGALSHRKQDGSRVATGRAPLPEKANPGNVIDLRVGGGHMGNVVRYRRDKDWTESNEAPFSEKLAEFFIRSFCPPGGIVYDPFCGSGTTLAVAISLGRYAIGCDIRGSQTAASKARCAATILPEKFPNLHDPYPAADLYHL